MRGCCRQLINFLLSLILLISLPLSLNQPGHRIGACFGKAALKTHALQTLRDRRASPNRAKRLECVRFIGAFRPARDGPRFMAAMHDFGFVEAFHEPRSAAVAAASCDGVSPPARTPGGTPAALAGEDACATSDGQFMVPMHAKKRKW